MQRIRIPMVVSVAVGGALLCWFYFSRPRRDAKVVAAAEDEVYEAVVRDMVGPPDGHSGLRQLVFDQSVITPPFNSLVDKVYRLVTRGGDDYSLRAAAIQDFGDRSCTNGRLSQTFHTDLPRTFTADDTVYFDRWPTRNKSAKSFERLFPGASGIISLSHVGFDANLDEAIVSTSFVCGGLCGTGKVYSLKKRWGRWRVVNQWIVWVS